MCHHGRHVTTPLGHAAPALHAAQQVKDGGCAGEEERSGARGLSASTTLDSLELEYGEDLRWQVCTVARAPFRLLCLALPCIWLLLWPSDHSGHPGVRGGPEAGAAGGAAGAAAEGGRAGCSRGIAHRPGGLQARCHAAAHAELHMLCCIRCSPYVQSSMY